MASFPDYYNVLNIPKDASTEDVKQAYRKESLKTHPDRLIHATTEERKAATEKFQAVADAYYVLSDPQRRREYDKLASSKPPSERTTDANASSNFFNTFASMFSNGGGGTTGGRQTETGPGTAPDQSGQRPNADRVFGDVFEDLLRPEVERHFPLWSWLGTACGAGLGFITASVPGLVVGATAGNRLGAIRDAKGKSVAAVFQEFSRAQKAEILHALALKVLGTAFT